MSSYAVEIIDGVVGRVIVANAQWAIENLGGFWVDSDQLVGNGWTWDETNGFQSPLIEP
jgi:hypothetical protein